MFRIVYLSYDECGWRLTRVTRTTQPEALAELQFHLPSNFPHPPVCPRLPSQGPSFYEYLKTLAAPWNPKTWNYFPPDPRESCTTCPAQLTLRIFRDDP
jgi:hypothetical protein